MMQSNVTKQPAASNIRLGLCCAFNEQPIKFGTTTATVVGKMSRQEGLAKLSRLCLANAEALAAALKYCAQASIGCFRINSQILPLKTHPTLRYIVPELPDGAEIVRRFQSCGDFARQHGLRTCFHPDQFVVLNSQRPEVVAASIREIEYQAEVAEWVAADVVNIHGGGAFGDKRQALSDLARNLDQLSPRARAMLTIENDDKIYSPADLLPLCRDSGIPLVYDVHHHRCLPDELTIAAATAQALATWNREQLFHLSSPKDGWASARPERHHDFIDIGDFPLEWRELKITVEIEAKAKETAVLKLKNDLSHAKPAGARRS